jgi:hypothetical protein
MYQSDRTNLDKFNPFIPLCEVFKMIEFGTYWAGGNVRAQTIFSPSAVNDKIECKTCNSGIIRCIW